MALVLTDEQTLLRESVHGLLEENAGVAALRRLRDNRDETGFSRSLWSQFVEMGFAGVLAPESDGGVGLGFVEAGVIMEGAGRTLAATPFLSTSVLAVTALTRAGSGEQKSAFLAPLISGEKLAALAIDETSKHAPTRISLKAEKRGSGFALTGAKAFVLDGHVADFLIVAARTGGRPG